MADTPEEVLNKVWNPKEPCLLLSKQVRNGKRTRKRELLEKYSCQIYRHILVLPALPRRTVIARQVANRIADSVYIQLELELYGCIWVDCFRDGVYQMWFPTCRELGRYAKPDSIQLAELINKSLAILNKTQS